MRFLRVSWRNDLIICIEAYAYVPGYAGAVMVRNIRARGSRRCISTVWTLASHPDR